MSDRVRIQLQQGKENIASEVPANISGDATIAAFVKLLSKTRKYKNDIKWERELTPQIMKAIEWVKRVKNAGGLGNLRGSGNVYRLQFTYDKEEYRIDIECHGAKDADWFGQ